MVHIMNIVMSTSDLYSHLALVTLESLFFANADLEDMVVYFIGDGLSVQSKRELRKIAEKFGRDINIIPFPEEYGRFSGSNRNGRTVFAYCFLQEILPKTVDKVLLLEPDQLVTDSLADLYATEIEAYYIAAADDLQSGLYKRKIGISPESPYVNCGMVLYNLRKWRTENLTDRMTRVLESRKHMLFYDVQDVINYVCEGGVKVLPPRFNATTATFLFDYKNMMRYRHPSTSCTESEFAEASNSPVVVHFTKNQVIQPRPWVEDCEHPYKSRYLDVRAETSMAEEPLWEYKPGLLNKLANKMYNLAPKALTASVLGIVHSYLYPALLYRFMFRTR